MFPSCLTEAFSHNPPAQVLSACTKTVPLVSSLSAPRLASLKAQCCANQNAEKLARQGRWRRISAHAMFSKRAASGAISPKTWQNTREF
jgi:hypothetical protein